jgi:hypothetical protein
MIRFTSSYRLKLGFFPDQIFFFFFFFVDMSTQGKGDEGFELVTRFIKRDSQLIKLPRGNLSHSFELDNIKLVILENYFYFFKT